MFAIPASMPFGMFYALSPHGKNCIKIFSNPHGKEYRNV